MGLVRKTLSIGTFGVIPFRSKKEQLRRADRARHEAEAELGREHDARERAERRVAAAEKRLRHSKDAAAHTAERLEAAKRRKRRQEAVRDTGSDAVARGRKAGRRARKSATKAAAKAAGKVAVTTREVVVPKAEAVATKIGEAVEDLTAR